MGWRGAGKCYESRIRQGELVTTEGFKSLRISKGRWRGDVVGERHAGKRVDGPRTASGLLLQKRRWIESSVAFFEAEMQKLRRRVAVAELSIGYSRRRLGRNRNY